MSCPTDVLLLHALQILKPQLEELMHVLQVLPFAERCGLRDCSMAALCAHYAHITVDDVRRAIQRRVRAAQCRCAVLSRDVTAAIARCDCSYRVMCANHHAMYHSYHAMYRDVSQLSRDASNSSRDVTHFLHNVVITNFETNGLP